MTDRLPPIPTPRAQLMRQVRLQYVPVVVFLLGLLSAGVIWTRWVAPPTLVGEAEALRADVRSTQAGMLRGEPIALMQPVTAGQLLGSVMVAEPNVIAASLAVIRAEIEMIRTTMDPIVGQQRALIDFERLQLDWMAARVKLASLQAELQLAERNLARTASLFANRMVTDEEFDAVKSLRDSLASQLELQSELVARLEPGIRSFAAGGALEVKAPELGLQAAIKSQEEQLRLTEAQLQPVSLVAPIDGVVTLVLRRPGEMVAVGEPILQISANKSERVIGFLRQPLPTIPTPGMAVELRTRTFERRIARSIVSEVGAQLEPIPVTLLGAMRLPLADAPAELGLRIHVAPPPGFLIRPGEHVDLILLD